MCATDVNRHKKYVSLIEKEMLSARRLKKSKTREREQSMIGVEPKKYQETSIVQQPVGLVPTTYYGPQPVSSSCDICMNKIITTVQYRKGVCTWMACTGITLIGGIFGCCLIPFYVNSCKDAYHSCPECGTLLGVYKRI